MQAFNPRSAVIDADNQPAGAFPGSMCVVVKQEVDYSLTAFLQIHIFPENPERCEALPST
jgi:hypothetical protein